MNATSLWDKTTLNTGVVHETGAQRSLTKAVETPMTVPLAGGALSSLCLVTISFVEYPWFIATGFVAAYTLFWVSLSAGAVTK
jgi:hypothetical protein